MSKTECTCAAICACECVCGYISHGDPRGDLYDRLALYVDMLATAKAECERYRLALESLTPGGSEYVRDPDRCVSAIQETRARQHAQILEQSRRRSEAESALAAARRESAEANERLDRIVRYCGAIMDGNAAEVGLARAIVECFGAPEFDAALRGGEEG